MALSTGSKKYSLRIPTALALLVLSVGVICNSSQRALEDFRYTASSTEVSFWGRGEYRPNRSLLATTAEDIDRLVIARPLHPVYLALAASANAWRGYYNLDRQSAMVFAQQALARQQAALRARPASLGDWALMARYAAVADRTDLVALASARPTQLRAGRN